VRKIAGYFETSDGARLYYEDRGSGRPIVLLHGWLCSSAFWRLNAEILGREFRVVTPDFRGHGNSSKILSGHTVDRYAEDVRELAEDLGLDGAVLVGWSLASSVVLAYWRKYARDPRLAALGIVDGAVAPMNPAEWNSHALRGFNYEAMAGVVGSLAADPAGFASSFVDNMFRGGKAPEEERRLLVREVRKTPPWIGSAIYSDFATDDLSPALSTVTVPSFVFAADSNVYKRGAFMGRHYAELMGGKFLAFEDAGHALFIERPEVFNAELAAFVRGLYGGAFDSGRRRRGDQNLNFARAVTEARVPEWAGPSSPSPPLPERTRSSRGTLSVRLKTAPWKGSCSTVSDGEKERSSRPATQSSVSRV